MTGDRLDRLARLAVREETYTAVVAPAIADLQYEARLGWWARVRAYIGAWRALLAAAGHEVAHDCLAVAGAVNLRGAVGPSVCVVVCLTALMIAPIVRNSMRSQLPWHHEAVLILVLLPVQLTFTLPAAALPFAAAYARVDRPGAKRAAFVLACAVLILVTTGNYALMKRAEPVAQELRMAAVEAFRYPELRNEPLWEVRNAVKPEIGELAKRQLEAEGYAAVRATRRRHQALATMLIGVTCALCGVLWRRRRWIAQVGMAVGVFVAHLAVIMAFQYFFAAYHVAGYAGSMWAPVVVLFLTACLLAIRSSPGRAERP